MGRITSEMTGGQVIAALSDGLPGAMEVLTKLMDDYGFEAFVFCALLDSQGLYGEDIWNSYKRVYGKDITKFAEAIRRGDIQRYEKPEGVVEMTYGTTGFLKGGSDIDREYQIRNPYELFWFRQAVDSELAEAGYPDYDGLIVVIAPKENLRLRVPVLDEEQGTKKALEFLAMFNNDGDED